MKWRWLSLSAEVVGRVELDKAQFLAPASAAPTPSLLSGEAQTLDRVPSTLLLTHANSSRISIQHTSLCLVQRHYLPRTQAPLPRQPESFHQLYLIISQQRSWADLWLDTLGPSFKTPFLGLGLPICNKVSEMGGFCGFLWPRKN